MKANYLVRTLCSVAIMLVSCLPAAANGQSVLFDFDAAPYRTSLPISLTVGAITANFSSNPSWYNYSIQRADALGFTPAGFAGLCIYPSTIYQCDLLISFDRALGDISIMYAPEEYATDSSCTIRITAFYGDRLVGTNTHTIDPPGTWPSGVVSLTSTEPFTRVVIHYDKAPVTGGDYGPIFMVDNLIATPWTTSYARIDLVGKNVAGQMMLGGVSVPFGSVTVLSTTNLAQPFQFLGSAAAAGDGSFQFEDVDSYTVRFYRVTYP